MSRHMTKQTKWHVHPGKTQISLGIRHEETVGPITTYWAYSEDWSVLVDAQADLCLRWAHKSFPWFCHAAAQIVMCPKDVDEMANSVDRNLVWFYTACLDLSV